MLGIGEFFSWKAAVPLRLVLMARFTAANKVCPHNFSHSNAICGKKGTIETHVNKTTTLPTVLFVLGSFLFYFSIFSSDIPCAGSNQLFGPRFGDGRRLGVQDSSVWHEGATAVDPDRCQKGLPSGHLTAMEDMENGDGIHRICGIFHGYKRYIPISKYRELIFPPWGGLLLPAPALSRNGARGGPPRKKLTYDKPGLTEVSRENSVVRNTRAIDS